MIRFAALFMICAGLALPVAAQSKKDKFCDELAAASQQIADLRVEGSSEQDAQLVVAAQFGDDQVTHLQMIPYLSSFVYGLSEEHLVGDVEGSFAEQCKGFKG